MSTGTNTGACSAPQKQTEIHILGTPICMHCVKLVLAIGILHRMATRVKKKGENPPKTNHPTPN